MDRYLVIGSNSFSGSHFCNLLLKEGHRVFGLSRSKEPEQVFTPYRWCESEAKHFQFQQLDINSDLVELRLILNSFKPHYVVNFAAQSMVAQSWDFPEHWINTNVLAITKIIDMVKSYDGLNKFVQISTPEILLLGLFHSKFPERAQEAKGLGQHKEGRTICYKLLQTFVSK